MNAIPARKYARIFSFAARDQAVYLPAFLLRNPHEKRTVWEDMKLLLREMQNSGPA